jgi:hypothetical protein
MGVEWPYILKSAQVAHALSRTSAANPETAVIVKSVMETAGIVGALVGPWGAVFLGGLILWGISKLFGISMKYMNAVGIVASTFVAAIAGVLIGLILTVATGTLSANFFSLGFLTHSVGPVAKILSGISLFSIWGIYIQVAGVSAVGGVSKGKAFGPAVITWLISILTTML